MSAHAIATAQALVFGLTLFALLVAYRTAVPLARRSAVVAQLRTLYWLFAALMVLRLVLLLWPVALFSAVLMLIAAWIPLVTLRLAEELVRRHAHRYTKIAILGGAIVFSVLAISVGLIWDRALASALAAWQSVSIVAIVALLIENRRSVSVEERQAADTLSLALVLAIPLVLTDFQALFPDLPVRGGSFALLLLLLATSRMAMLLGTPRLLLADMLIVAVSAAIFWGMLRLLVPTLDGATVFAITASGTALFTSILLLERFLALGREQGGLVAALAQCAPEAGKMELLAAHPLLSDGVVLSGAALADYPPHSITALAGHRVIGAGTIAGEGGDAARDVLTRSAATHLLRLSKSPPAFLAIAAGTMAGQSLDDELQLISRLIEDAP